MESEIKNLEIKVPHLLFDLFDHLSFELSFTGHDFFLDFKEFLVELKVNSVQLTVTFKFRVRC